jgi:uncharacterized protein YkwD
MHKPIRFFIILSLLFFLFSFPILTKARTTVHAPAYSTGAELIDAVNKLRASYGLAPYNTNSILMSIAQTHAEYLVSISTITHVNGQGLRPFQRALEAGYPVAGDLSLGGWFSENISAGVGQSADEAVQAWMGDDPHKNTILSGTLQDVGAGVGTSGNTYYYVLDAGKSTGGTPVAYTPPPPLHPVTPTFIPNTPNADGSIVHILQPGDTLGSLSLVYNVPLSDILKLNGLALNSKIYAGNKITIRAANTATPTQPTYTPSSLPTVTEWPTVTLADTAIPPTGTPTPAAGLPVTAAGGAVGAIVLAALAIAGLITLMGRKKK